MTARLDLTRAQILAFRRKVQALDERLPPGPDSLRLAAWAGLQDSMPRAALLSIHARVEETGPSTWEDPALVQLWGPRWSAYVVAARDRAPFTLGRLPEGGKSLRVAEEMAARLHAFLDGKTMGYGDVGDALGVNPNLLRYAAPTGTVLIRWDGARQATIWTTPAPDVDPREARLELARRTSMSSVLRRLRRSPGGPGSGPRRAGRRSTRSATHSQQCARRWVTPGS